MVGGELEGEARRASSLDLSCISSPCTSASRASLQGSLSAREALAPRGTRVPGQGECLDAIEEAQVRLTLTPTPYPYPLPLPLTLTRPSSTTATRIPSQRGSASPAWPATRCVG